VTPLFHGADIDSNPGRLLTVDEIARARRCSRRRILADIRDGRLPWLRLRANGSPRIPAVFAVVDGRAYPSTRKKRPR
jgi:hypothetical protein